MFGLGGSRKKYEISSPPAMAAVKKDDLFWNALMNHKFQVKKRLMFFKRKPKLDNPEELAEKYSITVEDVKKVHSIFIAMDDDSSGTISSTEVASMLMGFGCDVSPKVVQAVMRTSDVNGDGEINFEEFLCAVTSKVKDAMSVASSDDSGSRRLERTPEVTVPEIVLPEKSRDSKEESDCQCLGNPEMSVPFVDDDLDNQGNQSSSQVEQVEQVHDQDGENRDPPTTEVDESKEMPTEELNNNKTNIQAVFDKFDKNGDGLLSAEELVVAWRETLQTNLTVKEAAALIRQADPDGKGSVTRSEFIEMCQTI